MEMIEVREALQTAIMLGEVSQTSHVVEINGVGMVQIEGGQAALKSNAGEWKEITRDSLEIRLKELMSECTEERIRRQIDQLVFN